MPNAFPININYGSVTGMFYAFLTSIVKFEDCMFTFWVLEVKDVYS
jgi:hypothetical protein